MPREVEYEVRPGKWQPSSLYGPHGMQTAQGAGYPARYVGGVLQVNAKMNNRSDAGWVEAPATFQEMTPAEYEAAYNYMDARLAPYEIGTYKAVETGRTSSAQPNPAPVPQWQASRDLLLAPGECPCGILRAMCDYHRG